jgi:hypothetical protein
MEEGHSALFLCVAAKNGRLLRKLLEKNTTRLPLAQSFPPWAWDIQDSVDQRRDCCRCAVVALLSLSQPGNPLRSRDVMKMIAIQVWSTRFNQEWE